MYFDVPLVSSFHSKTIVTLLNACLFVDEICSSHLKRSLLVLPSLNAGSGDVIMHVSLTGLIYRVTLLEAECIG